MNYRTFIDTLISELSALFSADTTITYEQIEKNNGVLFDALLIHEPGQCVSPTIYLKPYFDRFCDEADLSTIASDIYHVYQLHQAKPPIDFQTILSGEQIRPLLTMHLINYRQNASMLPNCPHIPYLDLAVTFYCCIPIDERTDGSFLIRNEHLKLWNLSFDELKQTAFSNMLSRFPSELLPIQDLLKQIVEAATDMPDALPQDFYKRENPFYVLTNKRRQYGAVSLLYPNVLKDFARQINNNFYLIPSSVHEVLLFPQNPDFSPADLSKILNDVNTSQLPQTEILSDQIYLYSRQTETLSQISGS